MIYEGVLRLGAKVPCLVVLQKEKVVGIQQETCTSLLSLNSDSLRIVRKAVEKRKETSRGKQKYHRKFSLRKCLYIWVVSVLLLLIYKKLSLYIYI